MRQLLSESLLCVYANGRTSYITGPSTGFPAPTNGLPGAYVQQQYAQVQALGRAQIQGTSTKYIFIYTS